MTAAQRPVRRTPRRTPQPAGTCGGDAADADGALLARRGALLEEAEAARREREHLLRAVFDGAPDAMIITDGKGLLVDMNPAACQLFGAPRHELLGRSAAELVEPPFDHTALRRELVARGQLTRELVLRRCDGRPRHLELRTTADIAPGCDLSVLRDVTESRRVAEHLRAVVGHAPVSLFATDREGVFTLSDGHSLTRRGVPPGALVGASITEVYARSVLTLEDGSVLTASEVLARVLAGESLHGATEHRGVSYELHCGPMLDGTGRVEGLIGVATDVTARRAAEARLAESAALLRGIVESAPVAIVVLDREARVRLWNPAAEALFGWPAEAVVGGPLPIRDDHDELLRTLATAGTVLSQHVLRRHADGHMVEVALSASPLRDERGETVGRVGIFADLSERRRLEEQLHRAQQMESLGRLAAGIAHDFNNVLSAILGLASLARDSLDAADPVREDLGDIVEAAERAGRLTAQLLAFGRRKALSASAVDAGEIAAEATRMLRRVIPESIAIRVTRSEEPLTVLAGPGQLEQVVVNLVVNARDAMPNGGTVTIATREIGRGELPPVPDDDRADRWVLLSVEDTGVGMSEEVLQRVFEPFFTTKPVGHGTGLGLPTVYGIVQQSGGHIEVRSTLGAGTRVEIYLPRHEPEGAVARSSVPAPASAAASATVLLVEDEAMVRRMAERALRRAGYEVLVASDPAEALALSASRGGRIDLLLSDVVMPGMSGGELAEQLHAARPELRLLFMSGYAEDHLARCPGAALLPKPFAPAALLDCVRAVLEPS